MPGPISSEPVAIDGGKNWLSLTWGKAERRGPAPVIAYKVDAWLLGGDGGARWVEVKKIYIFNSVSLILMILISFSISWGSRRSTRSTRSIYDQAGNTSSV